MSNAAAATTGGGSGSYGGGAAAAASGKAPRRASSGKHTHSRSYPRGVGVDFKKLAGLTLLNYIDHHGAFVVVYYVVYVVHCVVYRAVYYLQAVSQRHI